MLNAGAACPCELHGVSGAGPGVGPSQGVSRRLRGVSTSSSVIAGRLQPRRVVARAGHDGAGMGPPVTTGHSRQEHEATRQKAGRRKPFPPFHACNPQPATYGRAQAQAQPFYWARPACPLLFPPHPSFWNLFLSSHLQPVNFQTPLCPIHTPDHFLKSKNSLPRWVTQRPTSSPSTPFGSWP